MPEEFQKGDNETSASSSVTNEAPGLEGLRPEPFKGSGAYGNDTQPGFMVFIAGILVAVAVAGAVIIVTNPKDSGGLLFFPVLFLVMAGGFVYMAVAKWRWAGEYKRLTGRSPWK